MAKIVRTMGTGNVADDDQESLVFADESIDDWDDDEDECEGHESLNGADMGRTVYCDGTCRH